MDVQNTKETLRIEAQQELGRAVIWSTERPGTLAWSSDPEGEDGQAVYCCDGHGCRRCREDHTILGVGGYSRQQYERLNTRAQHVARMIAALRERFPSVDWSYGACGDGAQGLLPGTRLRVWAQGMAIYRLDDGRCVARHQWLTGACVGQEVAEASERHNRTVALGPLPTAVTPAPQPVPPRLLLTFRSIEGEPEPATTNGQCPPELF
jgi:hypothetical protein